LAWTLGIHGPEGLSKNRVESIVQSVRVMGFNYIRLTYAVEMIDDIYSTGMKGYPIHGTIPDNIFEDMRNNNTWITETTTPIEVFDAVIQALSEQQIMIILDNHVSKAKWCCGSNDGNGWFGEKYFNVSNWERGLQFMASRYKENPSVVGYSLRNELRDSKDYTTWHTRMTEAGKLVHQANENALVIISGLNYDIDLSNLLAAPIDTMDSKLVHEFHWYSWDFGNWTINGACGNVTEGLKTSSTFLLEPGRPYSRPLLLTEFGVNLDTFGNSPTDDSFLDCVIKLLSETRIGFAVWGLQGSYYVHSGKFDYEESYGLLRRDWAHIRSDGFIRRLSPLFEDESQISQQY